MKHTMKKLLCMALAIMLLISVVPVFAAAEGTTTSVIVTIKTPDGTDTQPRNLSKTTTIFNAVSQFFPEGFDSKYNLATFTVDPSNLGAENLVEVVVDDTTYTARSVYVEFTAKPATISVTGNKGDGSLSGLVVGDPIALNNATLSTAVGYTVKSNEEVYWKVNGSDASGSTTATASMTISYTVAEKNTNNQDDENESVNTTGWHTVRFANASGDTSFWYLQVKDGCTVANPGKSYSTDYTYVSDNLTYDTATKELVGWSQDRSATTGIALSSVATRTITSDETWYPIFKTKSTSAGSTTEEEKLTDKVSDLQPVYLHVYLNNDLSGQNRGFTITDLAEDGTLNVDKDVRDYLLKYYTAKDANKGIGIDGLYVTDSFFGVKYLNDIEKYPIIGGDRPAGSKYTTLDRMRSQGPVHLTVMLTNAKAKTSATADSSNPKTGDAIFVPVMVMGLTASALAAAYVFGKKRIAR